MPHTTIRRRTALAAGALALGMAVSACSSSSDQGASSATGAGSGGDKGTITLGFIPSWTDGLSTGHLLKNQLEDMGYTVEMKTLTEPAPLYAGLAGGDVDIYPSAWPEVTHKSYMDKFGSKIEDLGTYYDNAKLTLAVPSYSTISSIEDLKTDPSRFDNKIVGIEAGAGLTKQVKEHVIPDYGLGDDYKLLTSSTTAMLAELKKATSTKKDIVVTLWRPFWANSAFDMKDLKDPKGSLGTPEGLHFLATKGFSNEHPDVAKLVAGIKLDDAQYGSLEDTVVNQFDKGQEDQAVAQWITKNPNAFDTELTGSN
jgi:glycine betaine/proline transport system substrate-binding protein